MKTTHWDNITSKSLFELYLIYTPLFDNPLNLRILMMLSILIYYAHFVQQFYATWVNPTYQLSNEILVRLRLGNEHFEITIYTYLRMWYVINHRL